MRISIPIELLIGNLVIGLVAGFLAERIIRGRGAGLVINLVVGVVGAFIGVVLFGFLRLSFHGLIGSLISATLGAVVLLLLLGLVRIMIFPQNPGGKAGRIGPGGLDAVRDEGLNHEPVVGSTNQNRCRFCEAIIQWRKT